jgi:hypothetical protein
VSLRDELKREAGVSPTIRWGMFGQLDVIVDGQVVFSKKTTGRMPRPGEVKALVGARRT